MASGTRSCVAAQACLLRLPDPCLLAVMQRCASDTRSTLTASISHSRLRQAAVEALSSIAAGRLHQARFNSLRVYLAKHGRHVRSLGLRAWDTMQLHLLPPSLTKLGSLQLAEMHLQLQPDVLRAGFPLTRLELCDCTLLDGAQGVAAALMQLPDLEHLRVDSVFDEHSRATFPTDVLTHLTKLTCLKLEDVRCQNRNSSSNPAAALQPLQALTRLADLQLGSVYIPRNALTADMLAGADQLTRLVLLNHDLEPRALAGKTHLQHLTLRSCEFVPAAGVAQLLSELQHLTLLTHLDLSCSCVSSSGPIPPAAAYASLTVSSKLQHLDFSGNTLPAAAWQYMCPRGRVLPQLRHLDISHATEAGSADASALVSCCPGLQCLKSSMPCSTAQLAPLQRLTGLTTLVVGTGEDDDLEGVQALCQLTGLQDLELRVARTAEARILQLTQLTHLTALSYSNNGVYATRLFSAQDTGGEPVWRQLLHRFVNFPDPAVAQQAAAAAALART